LFHARQGVRCTCAAHAAVQTTQPRGRGPARPVQAPGLLSCASALMWHHPAAQLSLILIVVARIGAEEEPLVVLADFRSARKLDWFSQVFSRVSAMGGRGVLFIIVA
jgi:hypothetical protein